MLAEYHYKLDRGRITIPQILRELAGIQDSVVILFGDDDYLELWGETSWLLEMAKCHGGF